MGASLLALAKSIYQFKSNNKLLNWRDPYKGGAG